MMGLRQRRKFPLRNCFLQKPLRHVAVHHVPVSTWNLTQTFLPQGQTMTTNSTESSLDPEIYDDLDSIV